MKVHFTLEDHSNEVISYCIKNSVDCLFTDNFEILSLFIVNCKQFSATEVYSSKSFSISKNQSSLKAKKFKIMEILEHFKFNNNNNNQQFTFFSVLLGTRWFSNESLWPFYKQLMPDLKYKKFEDLVSINFNFLNFDGLLNS